MKGEILSIDTLKEINRLKEINEKHKKLNGKLQVRITELEKRVNKVIDSIEHELYGHILIGDEVSWNPEFYTDGKLDYRKLLICLLEGELRVLKGSDINDKN